MRISAYAVALAVLASAPQAHARTHFKRMNNEIERQAFEVPINGKPRAYTAIYSSILFIQYEQTVRQGQIHCAWRFYGWSLDRRLYRSADLKGPEDRKKAIDIKGWRRNLPGDSLYQPDETKVECARILKSHAAPASANLNRKSQWAKEVSADIAALPSLVRKIDGRTRR